MTTDVKKQLMYLAGEDFYLFSYSLIIALDSLKCGDGRYFKDYRKLAFIVEFIKDKRLNYILSNTVIGKPLNPIDKECLFNSYSAGLGRRSEILKLLFMMEKKGYIFLEKGTVHNVVNVSLNIQSIPDAFFDRKLFSLEYANIFALRTHLKRLSALTLDSFLDRVYVRNGITVWAL